ncbi:hypothetical protein AGMMS49950_03260 [Endomicrobiia bacterium]|nr:hypothetical protein AGMMS49950_03260 [Endomicrobiia bacterium]
MKQKKKAGGLGEMSLVLMRVKKAFDKTKDSKEERKNRGGRSKKVQNSTE